MNSFTILREHLSGLAVAVFALVLALFLRNQRVLQSVCAILVAGLLAGCAATQPPPLPQNNPADPQVRSSSRGAREVLVRDEITLAIEKQLSATEADAKSAESMKHDMSNMPGMQQGDMQGMQHNGMKMEQPGQMKQSGEEMNPGAIIYTCVMHPQIRRDKPGKCPICGMTLIKKETGR